MISIEKYVLTTALVLISAVAFCQDSLEARKSFEFCALAPADGAKKKCFSNIFKNFLFNKLEDNEPFLASIKDNPTRFSATLFVDEKGAFFLKDVEIKNKELIKAVKGMLGILKPIYPIKNEKGDITTLTVQLLETYFLNKDGSLGVGIIKESSPFNDENNTSLKTIEQPPIYPGCEKFKEHKSQKKCITKKIQEFASSNFNTALIGGLDLKPGKQRIFADFTIADDGNVKNVYVRASHKLLEKETKRMITSLPKMKPGQQKGKAVNVLYSLPIVFMVEESYIQKKARLRRERKARKNKN